MTMEATWCGSRADEPRETFGLGSLPSKGWNDNLPLAVTSNRRGQTDGTAKLSIQSATPTGSAPSVGVLICSSDSRADVLERVLPSLFKYWPDCPYPIYVGRNTHYGLGPNVTTLVARRSDWRMECYEHATQIAESHLIVILDDFLLQRPVDQHRLSKLVSEAVDLDLAYLRLQPLGRSILDRLVHLAGTRFMADIQAISEGRPFYSGLQIAIWNKAHFLTLLKLQGSIWDFEHHRKLGVPHYAITGCPPISYSHLVERGRWLPYAQLLLSQAGLPADLGVRPIWPKWINLRLLLDKVCFHIFGYANH
jgi:hypothetical protein